MELDYSDHNPALAGLYPEHLNAVAAHFDSALERVGASHAVVFSGEPKLAFLDDLHYPFRANPHFLWFAPLTEHPLSYIVYTPGEKPVLVYYQPRDYWHATPDEPGGYWAEHFDIRIVHETAEAARHLPAERQKCVFLGELDDPAFGFDIERINPESLLNILHFARGRKTEYELACLRLASRRAVLGHRAAERGFRGGGSEFEIHQAYCAATRLADNELPYGNIIALNHNGATLHYTKLERSAPAHMRSFLIDAGAQVHGYAADVTRTYSYEDPHFADLISRMNELQLDIVGDVLAGADYRQLHINTHRHLARLLVDVELASGNVDTLIATGVTSAFFPHGLGHLLGLQVHDVGGYMENDTGGRIDPPSGHAFLRLTRVLEEDMVLTVEPGLYVIDMLLNRLKGSDADDHVNWKRVDELRPFGGIRIEDNVRVLGNGSENLTRDAFADLG
ncbi:MAG: Xaa-Pro dipeptidase [Pseudomonadota bacterium]